MGASLTEQASTLAEWGLPRAGLLILMSPCENRCYFCAQPAVTHPPPQDWTPPERVVALLEQNRSLGLDRLCIGGTEPVTHPSFTDALRRAKDVGFSAIELMTSGLRLSQPGVANAWRDAGITRIAVPISRSRR
jgi:molybdenum cofactor biosynthesis enzyme MoaA